MRSNLKFAEMLRHPSAFLPLAMSGLALLIVLAHVAMHGAARQADEGAVAHLWQLLMVGQAPIILFFAVHWLPQATRSASLMLAIHCAAALAAIAPVYFLHL